MQYALFVDNIVRAITASTDLLEAKTLAVHQMGQSDVLELLLGRGGAHYVYTVLDKACSECEWQGQRPRLL